MLPGRRAVVAAVTLAFLARSVTPALAVSPVKLQNWAGSIDLSAPGPVPFTLAGTASHLGRFTARGEVEFAPGDEDGSLVGEGVVVFTAANGDQLAGVVTWDVDGGGDVRTTGMHFSWRDSVTFSDGTVATSTGRFLHDRPPGLVVIAIIAVLLALLVPAYP
jgi:hypothetical protein